MREVTRFEANTEIVMGRGPKPNDPNAFDAREVMQNIGPRVMRPGSELTGPGLRTA